MRSRKIGSSFAVCLRHLQHWQASLRHEQWRRWRPLLGLLRLLRWLGIGTVVLWAISCGPHTTTLTAASARLAPQLLVDALLHATEAQGALLAILLIMGVSWSVQRQRRLAAGLFAVRQSPPQALVDLVGDIIPHRRLFLLLDDRPYTACIGFWRPAVYVTHGFVSTATSEALRAALAHEEAHRRRHDPLRLFVLRSLTRMLRFAPGFTVIAAISNRVELRAEVCADRFACAVTSRAALAQALLLMLRSGVPSITVPSSASASPSAAHSSASGQRPQQTPSATSRTGLRQSRSLHAERLAYLLARDEQPLPPVLHWPSAQDEQSPRQSVRLASAHAASSRGWGLLVATCGLAFAVFVGVFTPLTPLYALLTACTIRL